MEIVFLPEAESELEAAKNSYQAVAVEAALSFVAESERMLRQLAGFPRSGSRKQGYRRCIFLKFPYAMVYTILEHRIMIVAVTHTSQRPGYWRSRLRKI
jgi:plasmid stabilization system protein ParE